MLYSKNRGIMHIVIFCLVLVLSGGCKTLGSRTQAEQEEQQQRGKRKWGGIALAVIGAAAVGFGGTKLAKLLKNSDFNKQINNYLKLMKKHAQNPDDEQIAKELEEVGNRIDNLVTKAESDEIVKKYNEQLSAKMKTLRESESLRKLEIKHLEGRLANLQAGVLDEEMLVEAKTFMQSIVPNPRNIYKSFDEYHDAARKEVLAKLNKIDESGAIQSTEVTFNEKQVDGLRKLWDDYDKTIEGQLKDHIKMVRVNAIDVVKEQLEELRKMG